MTCEANCTDAFYQQFPLKKSSNPCAFFIFECYFARILILFLTYCGNSLTMFHSSLIKCRWEKTGDGEGEKRGRRGGDMEPWQESFLRSSCLGFLVSVRDIGVGGEKREKSGEKTRPEIIIFRGYVSFRECTGKHFQLGLAKRLHIFSRTATQHNLNCAMLGRPTVRNAALAKKVLC